MSASSSSADEAEPPATPRVSRPSARSMHVLATPIISVAVTPRSSEKERSASAPSLSNPPYEVVKPTKSAPNASAWPVAVPEEARHEPPAGIVEGVTFVEPRAVPGNGSELDSVILGPGVQTEALVQREGERRRAPTIRTRLPFRREPLAPTSARREPSRRSTTLLAGVIALALISVGVSALLHSETDPERGNEVAQLDVPRQHLDVQAALPQPSAALSQVQAPAHPAETAAVAAVNAAEPAETARANVADPTPVMRLAETPAAEGTPVAVEQVAHSRAAASPARSAPTHATRSAALNQRVTSKRTERTVDGAKQSVSETSESKSWIKVRD